MNLSGGIINTFSALIFAIVLVAVFWGLASYFTGFGSVEEQAEGKDLVLGAVTFLFLLMCVYAIVVWVRSSLGF
jgi:hypothetical protein